MEIVKLETHTYPINSYLVYVNPYYLVRHFGNDQDVSKHYYLGAQRIASNLYEDVVCALVVADDPVEDNPSDGPGDPSPESLEFPNVGGGSEFDLFDPCNPNPNTIVLTDLDGVLQKFVALYQTHYQMSQDLVTTNKGPSTKLLSEPRDMPFLITLLTIDYI